MFMIIVTRALIGAVIGWTVGLLLNKALASYRTYQYKRSMTRAEKTMRTLHLLNRN